MPTMLPLSDKKKLRVLHRVEPGCLGANGADQIVKFCEFAQCQFTPVASDFIVWEIIPRFDKTLAETQFYVDNKQLTEDKAAKYLSVFGQDINVFEQTFSDKLMLLIEEFLGR